MCLPSHNVQHESFTTLITQKHSLPKEGEKKNGNKEHPCTKSNIDYRKANYLPGTHQYYSSSTSKHIRRLLLTTAHAGHTITHHPFAATATLGTLCLSLSRGVQGSSPPPSESPYHRKLTPQNDITTQHGTIRQHNTTPHSTQHDNNNNLNNTQRSAHNPQRPDLDS